MWFRVVLLIGLLCSATPVGAHEWVDYFASDDAVLSPRGFTTAREVAAYWRRDPDHSFVVIDAYLDAEEASRAENPTDRRRARAMMLELVRQGVQPARIRINLHGDSHQARPSTASEPLNRRITLNVRADPLGSYPLDHSDQPYFFFDTGSTAVTEEHVFAVRLAMATMMNCAVTGALVTAGADTVGSSESNRRLSDARAEAISRLFAREGVPWEGIRIESRGDRPLARPTADEVADQLNRRADASIFRVCGGR